MFKKILNWISDLFDNGYDYYNWSTDPAYGLFGSHYVRFRQHRETNTWEGFYITPGIGAKPYWFEIGNEELRLELEKKKQRAVVG